MFRLIVFVIFAWSKGSTFPSSGRFGESLAASASSASPSSDNTEGRLSLQTQFILEALRPRGDIFMSVSESARVLGWVLEGYKRFGASFDAFRFNEDTRQHMRFAERPYPAVSAIREFIKEILRMQRIPRSTYFEIQSKLLKGPYSQERRDRCYRIVESVLGGTSRDRDFSHAVAWVPYISNTRSRPAGKFDMEIVDGHGIAVMPITEWKWVLEDFIDALEAIIPVEASEKLADGIEHALARRQRQGREQDPVSVIPSASLKRKLTIDTSFEVEDVSSNQEVDAAAKRGRVVAPSPKSILKSPSISSPSVKKSISWAPNIEREFHGSEGDSATPIAVIGPTGSPSQSAGVSFIESFARSFSGFAEIPPIQKPIAAAAAPMVSAAPLIPAADRPIRMTRGYELMFVDRPIQARMDAYPKKERDFIHRALSNGQLGATQYTSANIHSLLVHMLAKEGQESGRLVLMQPASMTIAQIEDYMNHWNCWRSIPRNIYLSLNEFVARIKESGAPHPNNQIYYEDFRNHFLMNDGEDLGFDEIRVLTIQAWFHRIIDGKIDPIRPDPRHPGYMRFANTVADRFLPTETDYHM